MLKLCLKDIRTGGRLWALIAALTLLASIFPGGALLPMILGPAMALGCLALSLGLDEWDKTDILYAALPLSRKDIVKGRFALAAMLTGLGGGLALGRAAAAAALTRDAGQALSARLVLSPEAVLGFLALMAVLVSAWFPLYFRLGFGRAALIFPIGLAAAAAGAWALIGSGVLRSFTAAVRQGQSPADPGAALLAWLRGFRGEIGWAAFLIVPVLGSTLLAALSYFSSVKLFKKRDL